MSKDMASTIFCDMLMSGGGKVPALGVLKERSGAGICNLPRGGEGTAMVPTGVYIVSS
jgi:hypothetical protein